MQTWNAALAGIVSAILCCCCGGDDGRGSSGETGTSTGPAGTESTGGTSEGGVSSETGTPIGEGMYGRGMCTGQAVEARCEPEEITLIVTSSYFFLQCFDNGARFEIWVFNAHLGDLVDTGSWVDFICPGSALDNGLRLWSGDGPGRMTVQMLEPKISVVGEFAADDPDLSGWFNVIEK